MRAALADCPEPGTVVNWLRNSRSARLLADLVATGRPLTHADLDATATSRATAMTAEYLGGLLIAYQVLPERDELGARITRHLERVTTRHPDHAVLLRSYVRWSLLPRARRRQRLRGGSFKHRVHWAYTRINLAAAFLATLADRGMTISQATQHDVDAWLARNPARHDVRDFMIWAHRHHHARALEVPHRPKADPVGLDEDSKWDLLHQRLTDTGLPLEVRAAGAILLLFGQHLTRITAAHWRRRATTDWTAYSEARLTATRNPMPEAHQGWHRGLWGGWSDSGNPQLFQRGSAANEAAVAPS
ncbi:hypothetical protein ABZ819_34370 [Streptomyces venezuelae]|uniref:hypothetical protein n=1 Tax=Streptomyces venezuelae TaxID=54571 RepID=UPI00343AE2FC